MRRFRNLLAVIDDVRGESPALARATALARANEGRLTLAACLEPMPLAAGTPGDELESILRGHYLEFLGGLRERLVGDGLPVSARLLEGIPFIEIIREVVRGRHDIVLKPAEASARGSQHFGSTDLHLIRKCPCPVLVVPPEPPTRFTRVLAAIDPASEDPEVGILNDRILELATSLAAGDAARLDVLHCWQLPAEAILRSRTGTRFAELSAAEEAAHRRALAELVARFERRGAAMEPHLVHGDPRAVIPDFVRSRGVDALVMGTSSRSPIPGFLIGSTAEEVLAQIRCAVLAVKPPSFVTPIGLEG